MAPQCADHGPGPRGTGIQAQRCRQQLVFGEGRMFQLLDRGQAVVRNRSQSRGFVRRREHRTRAARRIVKYLVEQQLLFPGGSHVYLHGRQPEAGCVLLQQFESKVSERDNLCAGIGSKVPALQMVKRRSLFPVSLEALPVVEEHPGSATRGAGAASVRAADPRSAQSAKEMKRYRS